MSGDDFLQVGHGADFSHVGHVGQVSQVVQVGHTGQVAQVLQVGRVGQVADVSQVGHVGQEIVKKHGGFFISTVIDTKIEVDEKGLFSKYLNASKK
jgi:hypothetical protein